MRVVVVGGGGAGLLTALMLARNGHDVVVLERDRIDAAPEVETAASVFRAGAPQIVQPHIFMAHFRAVLRERLPDLYARLLAAGVREAPLRAFLPGSIAGFTAQPGDEALTALVSRRSTVDWVLLRAVLGEPAIRYRPGTAVRSLAAASGRPPVVTGVRTGGGTIEADAVVDATGHRSPIDRWLDDLGAARTRTERAECGLAYYSRHYRIRPGATLPAAAATRTLVGLDEFSVGIWGGDNGTVQIAVVPLAADRRRHTLRDPRRFTVMLDALPFGGPWLHALEPITEVHPMGGLHNTVRRLVVDGNPVALRLYAVGDSVCTTNPTLSRGMSLAAAGAAALADVLAAHARDPAAAAQAVDQFVRQRVRPHYREQAAIDGARLAQLRHAVLGHSPPPPVTATPGSTNYAELREAARTDPTAFRAFWQIQGMTRPPEEVYTDPVVVTATRAALNADPVAEKSILRQAGIGRTPQ